MKVLIISHNPITTYQSMGKTMLSLFSEFSPEELCQLYIYPSLPDVEACCSYFRITDRNVLQSYFRFGKMDAKCITAEQIDRTKHDFYESKDDEKFLNKRKTSWRVLARDLMWKCANWYSRSLKLWLAEQKPDRIFLAPGSSKFIYDIALRICKDLQIPIVTYVCDEFYFVNPPKTFSGKIQLRLLKKKIRKLMKASTNLVTICDELSEAYSREFDLPATTILTGTNYPIAEGPVLKQEIFGITYLGNLAYGRLTSVLDVGKALMEINQERNTAYKLFLYTRSLSEEQQNALTQVPTVEYCGYVTGETFENVLHGADMLLHIEDFSPEAIDRVKHSVSTKIADSLGSGIPLFAYAPDAIASVTYLKKHNACFVATEKNMLTNALRNALDLQNRTAVSQRAIETAQRYHCSETNSRKLYGILKALN